MNKFTFSILYLSAKSDLSKSMNKAHSPSGLFVEWSWLKSSISDLWKSFGGKQGALFVFTPNQTKKSFLKKNFPQAGNWEKYFILTIPSTWNFLQEITSLPAAAARWNRHSWCFHACWSPTSLCPAAARAPQPAQAPWLPMPALQLHPPIPPNCPQIPHSHSSQAPANGDRTCQASQLYSRKLGSPGAS